MVCPDAKDYEKSHLGISGYITMLVLHSGKFVAHEEHSSRGFQSVT